MVGGVNAVTYVTVIRSRSRRLLLEFVYSLPLPT
jgi:hypothetical protein